MLSFGVRGQSPVCSSGQHVFGGIVAFLQILRNFHPISLIFHYSCSDAMMRCVEEVVDLVDDTICLWFVFSEHIILILTLIRLGECEICFLAVLILIRFLLILIFRFFRPLFSYIWKQFYQTSYDSCLQCSLEILGW